MSIPVSELSDTQLLHYRDLAIEQLKFAREYLLTLLTDVSPEIWTLIPSGATSHIAWQVGHLAVAEYGLFLFRQRGRAEGDVALMPGWLRKNYGKGTQASADPSSIPSSDEFLAILERIHRQALEEAATFGPPQLAEPAEMPYAVFPIKLGALLFAPLHESIHIGQIGLLRRLHGRSPVR